MDQSRILLIVRQFWENAIKLLLEDPKNARDLLALCGADIVKRIDLRRVKLIQTTFVERDYRHVESDVVLLAPLRRERGERTAKHLLIYILIEHQSEPDRLMPLRSLDYVVQIFKYQVREWSKTHRTLARIRLHPVLPVVFYTGTQRWDSVGRLVDLVEMGERFESATPAMEPLFINLPVIAAETLEAQGGFFGWVLRLIQQRKSRPREFQRLLNRVVQHLETMPQAERRRWLELLSYIMALVYHVREPSEWPRFAAGHRSFGPNGRTSPGGFRNRRSPTVAISVCPNLRSRIALATSSGLAAYSPATLRISGRGVEPQQQVGAGQLEEMHRVRLDRLAHVHQLAQQLRRPRHL